MNKTSRRQVRVLPPLRGHLAANASPELKRRFSEPLVFKSPEIAKSRPRNNIRESTPPVCKCRNYLVAWFLIYLFLLAIALIVRQQF